jgi:hypothetical protein
MMKHIELESWRRRLCFECDYGRLPFIDGGRRLQCNVERLPCGRNGARQTNGGDRVEKLVHAHKIRKSATRFGQLKEKDQVRRAHNKKRLSQPFEHT